MNLFRKKVRVKSAHQEKLILVAIQHRELATQEVTQLEKELGAITKRCEEYECAWGSIAPQQAQVLRLQELEAQKKLLKACKVWRFDNELIAVLEKKGGVSH